MSSPQYGERSPDGHYWWDGGTWQLIDTGAGGAETGAAESSAQAAGTTGSAAAAPSGPAPDQPGEPATGQDRLLAKVSDPSELQTHFENAMQAGEQQAQSA